MEKGALAPGGRTLSSVNPNWLPIGWPARSVSETAICTPSTGDPDAFRTSPTTTGPIEVGRVLIDTTEIRLSEL